MDAGSARKTTFPCRNIELKLKKKGSVTGNVFISLYTDAGVTPGTEIAQSGNVSISTISDTGDWVQFSFSQSQIITAGLVYWIVLQCDYAGSPDCIGWGWNNTMENKNWTFNNGTWADYSLYTVGALYRVYSGLDIDLSENQMIPKTASDEQNFLVVWQSLNGSGYGIYGQVIAPSGGFIGDKFQINSFTNNLQLNPAVASNGQTYCVLWDCYDNDGYQFKYQLPVSEP